MLFTYYELVLNHECLSADLRPRKAVDKVKILKYATKLEQVSFSETSTRSANALVIPSICILFLYCQFCNNFPYVICIFNRIFLLKKLCVQYSLFFLYFS